MFNALLKGIVMRSVVISLVVFSSAAFGATAEAKERCWPVNARLQTTFGACPADFSSPIGLCSSGTLKSWFERATTRFRATNAAYSAGLPDTEAATTLSYTGDLEISDRHGTILLADVGLSDMANGIFTELSRVKSATGRYAGVTGKLFITGYASADGSGFTGEVSGKICR